MEFDKNFKLIALISLGISLLVYIVLSMQPVSYKIYNTFFIDRLSDPNPTQYFTYEGLYSQQTAERFTDSLKGLLESKNVLALALEKAGMENSQITRRQLEKSLTVRKTGPQVLYLEVKGSEKDAKIVNGLTSVIEEYVNGVNSQSGKQIIFKKVSNEPVVETVNKYAMLAALSTFLIISIFAISLIEIKKYLDS